MRARTLRVSTIGDRSVQASLRRPLPLIVSEPAVTVAMSAGVADSGNTVIGRRPRRSSLSIVPIALLDVCTASLRVLRRACPSVAGHSKSDVDDLSVLGVEQRVPIWQSRSVSRQRRVPRLFSRLGWLA